MVIEIENMENEDDRHVFNSRLAFITHLETAPEFRHTANSEIVSLLKTLDENGEGHIMGESSALTFMPNAYSTYVVTTDQRDEILQRRAEAENRFIDDWVKADSKDRQIIGS